MTRFIAYYRISTARQAASGLGLEAQRKTVRQHIRSRDEEIIAEFTEVESGRRSDRPELERAFASARLHRATLIVAKVDRLTRSVSFLSRLLDAGVDVNFADLPNLNGPTGKFLLQQMAAVAELEAGLIAARTKLALAAAKERGTKLGGYRNATISDNIRRIGNAARTTNSERRASDLAPLLEELRAGGTVSNTGLAKALECRGIPSARGGKGWTSTQVARVLARLGHT